MVKASQFNKGMDALRDATREAAILWWKFFDWLAVVEWRKLIIISILVMIVAGILNVPEATWFVIISVGVKILAGGKRRAELVAEEATKQADIATLERRLLEAQMATLQAQVEPHFLFNTLALIGQLIETDPPQAAKIHQHLIEYLRATLPQLRSNGGGGTLGRQVELSRAYLAIMQARMKQRLTVSFDVPDYLEYAQFPPMMLQILIENSIKHGLEPKIEGGHILVTAMLVDGTLQVDVRDNGVGFNMKSGDGVGLANVRERLHLLYGSRAELVIEAPVEGGALVSIRVPFSTMEK